MPQIIIDWHHGYHHHGSWHRLSIYFGVFLLNFKNRYWSLTDVQCYVSFRRTAHWFDSSLHHWVLTIFSMVTICLHVITMLFFLFFFVVVITMVLAVFPLLYFLSPWLTYFTPGNSYFFFPFIYFTHRPTHLPCSSHQVFLHFQESVFSFLCSFILFFRSHR